METKEDRIIRGLGIASAPFADCKPVPDGVWKGKLLSTHWGKSTNLFCIFLNLETNEMHSVSAFRTRDGAKRYTPKDEVIDFSYEEVNQIYELKTGKNSKGNPAWFTATKA